MWEVLDVQHGSGAQKLLSKSWDDLVGARGHVGGVYEVPRMVPFIEQVGRPPLGYYALYVLFDLGRGIVQEVPVRTKLISSDGGRLKDPSNSGSGNHGRSDRPFDVVTYAGVCGEAR